jgi:hypothetical protein
MDNNEWCSRLYLGTSNTQSNTRAKKIIPQRKAWKKPYFAFLPEIAKKRGTSPTHPNHPRLYGGNASISKTLDRRDARTGSKERKMSTIRNTDISPSVN